MDLTAVLLIYIASALVIRRVKHAVPLRAQDPPQERASSGIRIYDENRCVSIWHLQESLLFQVAPKDVPFDTYRPPAALFFSKVSRTLAIQSD